MSEKGVVVRVNGDHAVVEMEASKACEACGACRYSREGRMVATVRNQLNANVGDSVDIEIEPKVVIGAALVVYMLPLVMFFLGYAIGIVVGRLLNNQSEIVGIMGGLIFLAFSYLAMRKIDKRAGISRRFEPRMCDVKPTL